MLIILIVGAVLLLVGTYVVLLNGVNGVNALNGQTPKPKRKQGQGAQGADGGLSPASRPDGTPAPLGPVRPPFPKPTPPATGPAARPSPAVPGDAKDAAFAS